VTRGRDAQPVTLLDRGRRLGIARIQDSWRIDDEWWRDPIRRRYYQVILDDGSFRTLYHDLVTDCWYTQNY
jgi:hypothetical protein